jgi:hypothetical protein
VGPQAATRASDSDVALDSRRMWPSTHRDGNARPTVTVTRSPDSDGHLDLPGAAGRAAVATQPETQSIMMMPRGGRQGIAGNLNPGMIPTRSHPGRDSRRGDRPRNSSQVRFPKPESESDASDPNLSDSQLGNDRDPDHHDDRLTRKESSESDLEIRSIWTSRTWKYVVFGNT